jgi:hypothetical protein
VAKKNKSYTLDELSAILRELICEVSSHREILHKHTSEFLAAEQRLRKFVYDIDVLRNAVTKHGLRLTLVEESQESQLMDKDGSTCDES